MKPFPGKNLDEPQRVFNFRPSRARRTIENAFGILSAKWRVFRRPIRANVEFVERITKATVCLHNYGDSLRMPGTSTQDLQIARMRLAKLYVKIGELSFKMIKVGLLMPERLGGNRATHLMLANIEKTSKITLAVKNDRQLGNGNMSETVILYILNAPLSKF